MQNYIVALFFIIVSITVSPTVAVAQSQVSVEDSYRASLLALINLLEKQIAMLLSEVERRQADGGVLHTNRHISTEKTDSSITYGIQNATQLHLITNANHRAYFSRVYELFPQEYAGKVKQFRILKDSSAYFDAFIETLPPDHLSWRYSVREELTNSSDSLLNAELIVHELAHIISYEPISGVVVTSPQERICHPYFTVYGCPPQGSYLDQFIQQFWLTADLDRAKRLSQSDNVMLATHSHYEKNSDLYVTDYAALNPEEDFAESFMFYVFGKEFTGNQAAEKVHFFSQYPKLVSVRDQVLKNI